MSAVTLAPCPSVIPSSPTNSSVPGALQQVLHRIEEQGNANLRASERLHNLKADLENRWQIANSEGLTSSTMLYQVLEYGWKELRRITA
jgi:hypothetical protein